MANDTELDSLPAPGAEQTPPEGAAPGDARAEDLSDEIAQKYAPERLLGMVGKRAGKGEALEHGLRSKYEKRLGVDLSHVRIFSGEFAEEFNKKRDAYAVTVGATGMILMGGQTEKHKSTHAGEALLAHELTHVAQAKSGLKSGLHRSGTFQGEFTAAHEIEAHAFEDQIEHELSHSGAAHIADMTQIEKHKERLAHALEKVKDRVLDMATDGHRNLHARSGTSRRA